MIDQGLAKSTASVVVIGELFVDLLQVIVIEQLKRGHDSQMQTLSGAYRETLW